MARGAVVPEAVKLADYRREIQERVTYFRGIAKAHNIVLE